MEQCPISHRISPTRSHRRECPTLNQEPQNPNPLKKLQQRTPENRRKGSSRAAQARRPGEEADATQEGYSHREDGGSGRGRSEGREGRFSEAIPGRQAVCGGGSVAAVPLPPLPPALPYPPPATLC
eukprot:2491351-Rhodomonas_salina.1